MVSSACSSETIPTTYNGIPGLMCKKEGVSFRNPMINGKPLKSFKEIYGEVREGSDGFELINGKARHRFTGKNEEWNLAFEKFIGAGPENDNPVLWVCFDTDITDEYVYEIDVKAEEEDSFTLSVWN